jgi:hypothetical protein
MALDGAWRRLAIDGAKRLLAFGGAKKYPRELTGN